ESTVLEFLGARSARQREAYLHIRAAVAAYDVECIDSLIGDISAPAELMKTQTDRKIADELQRTYDVQRAAQIRRLELERETAAAQLATARGESEAAKIRALAQAEVARTEAAASADARRLQADADADAIRA